MKKILIVDDDHAVVDLLVSALGGEDRAVRFAYDGEAALQWMAKDKFDLIICDLMMPKKHGLQLIRQIRANPDSSGIKILMLTAKSFQRDVQNALKSGADLFVSKPFELADLAQKVNQLLS